MKLFFPLILLLALVSFKSIKPLTILEGKQQLFFDSNENETGVYIRCDSLLYFYYYTQKDSIRHIDDRSDDIIEYYNYIIHNDTIKLYYDDSLKSTPAKYLFKREKNKLSLQMVFNKNGLFKLAKAKTYSLSKNQSDIPIASETFGIDSLGNLIDEFHIVPQLICK